VHERDDHGGNVVFVLHVGRKHRADPKWLLPMVCRRGDVSRSAIGAFRIGEETTEVDVRANVAEHFARSAARKDSDDIRVTRMDGVEPRRESFRKARDDDRAGGKPPFRPAYKGQKPWGKRGDDMPPSLAEAVPYEMRKPYAERAAAGGEKDVGSSDATKTDYPSKKRFPPKGDNRGPAGTPKHARTGFQHRKGSKGKRPT
jgi:ATP-dependent RNA helicase DeaD